MLARAAVPDLGPPLRQALLERGWRRREYLASPASLVAAAPSVLPHRLYQREHDARTSREPKGKGNLRSQQWKNDITTDDHQERGNKKGVVDEP